jgi:NCS1 family nucleobase:cation symporter-1
MYWISDAFSISNWRIGASLISIGLSWKLALVAVVIGNFVTALVVTYNGIIGESRRFKQSVALSRF